MAATAVSTNHESIGKIVLSCGLTVALIALLVFVFGFTQRRRPTVYTTLRLAGHPYIREARQRKGVETFMLESMPIVKYSAVLQGNEQIQINKDDHPLLYASLPRRGSQPKDTYPEATAVATFEGKEGGDTAIKDPIMSNPKNGTSQQIHTIQDRIQSMPNHEPVSCSICTENFLDRENVRVLPCAHIYHQRCIDSWLLDFSGTCPLCRKNLLSCPTPSLEPPAPALLSIGSRRGPHPRAPL